MKFLIFPAFLSCVFFLLQIFVDVQYSFVSDPLVKGIQIESLRKSNYSTLEFYYPIKDLDELAEFQPMPRQFVFSLNKKIFSQYPIAFAFVYSLLPLSVSLLPFTNSLVLFFILFLLKKFLNFCNLSLSLFLFGTVVFPISFDLSENPIFLLLICIGFLFFIKFLEVNNKKFFVYSSFFIGLAVWFRLEALVFYVCLVFSLFAFMVLKKFTLSFFELSFGFACFISVFLIFGIFNYLECGLILGPRYFVNYAEHELNILEKFTIFLDIVFTRIEYGLPKFGFFFYSPILLFTLFLLLKHYKTLSKIYQFLIVFSVIFILGIGLSAPNNGISVTGRYLSILVFPLLFLLNANLDLVFKNGFKKLFPYSFIVWSFLISFVSFVTLKFGFKNVREYQTYFSNLETHIWIFTSRASSGFVGFEYLNRKIFSLESLNQIQKFYKILNKNPFQEFSVFFLEEEFAKQNKIYQYNQTKMFSELAEQNYSCIKKESFQQLTRFHCTRQQ